MPQPEKLRYAKTHEWAEIKDGIVTVGITDFAVKELGDIVFIDLPKVGTTAVKGEAFGEVESTKAVSDLFAPVGGEIVEVNDVLREKTKPVESFPFDDGWLIRIRPSDPNDFFLLFTHAQYVEHLKSQTGH